MVTTRRRAVDPAIRFWSKVKGGANPDDCWVWSTPSMTNGYGLFNDGSRQVRAHRWAYEQMVGPIPEGLVLDHLCRNRACVNPAHLEPVTQAVNHARGVRATTTACRRGHEYSADNTYVRWSPWGSPYRDCRECKRMRDRARRRGMRLESPAPLGD